MNQYEFLHLSDRASKACAKLAAEIETCSDEKAAMIRNTCLICVSAMPRRHLAIILRAMQECADAESEEVTKSN